MLRELLEFNTDYNPSDVTSKVAAIQKQVTPKENTVSFGLEDSDGGIIKVYVTSDQAEEFERALSRQLDSLPDDSTTEIAELLYNMRSDFNIINVEWPNIVEDEEEVVDSGEVGMDGIGDDKGPDGIEDDKGPDAIEDMGEMPADSGTPDVDTKSAFDAVLQVMTADAEAKRQEAIARTAEAKAKEAEAAASMADRKLRAEEEVADMEAFYKSKTEEQKEAKKLAKLAQYRHDTKRDDTSDDYELSTNQLTDKLPPSAEPEEGMDELEAGIDGDDDMQSPTQDLDATIDMSGVEEDEEAEQVDGPQTTDRMFKDLESSVKYLQSLQTRRAQE